MADRSGGIPGWGEPDRGGWRPPGPRERDPPYVRAIGWAILAWVVTVGIVYLVAQVLGAPQLGGWVGFAGFLVGYWFGGTQAGLKGLQEWTLFIVMLSVIAFFLVGVGSCVYAMALYG